MPRFHVIAFDKNDEQTCNYITKEQKGSDAICKLPWFQQIYKDEWVQKNIWAPDTDSTISNCHQLLGWVVICVNLDEAIMNALNGGDSSACLPTQQN
jgi:hypothetical protein